MDNDRRDLLFNILTYVVLVATLCLVIYYALIGFGVDSLNPLPPGQSPLGAYAVAPWLWGHGDKDLDFGLKLEPFDPLLQRPFLQQA